MLSFKMILISLVFIIFAVQESFSVIRPGRRVCPIPRSSLKVIPSQQTYRRPFVQPCDNETECGNSTQIVYKIAVRTVFYRQVVHDSVRKCCPGWTNFEPNEENCMKPICKEECLHDGTCVGPDYCECPRNYTGRLCHLDVNECKTGHHTCHQLCNNTFGGYTCYCYDGFRMNKDGKCEFCPLCVKDFESVMNKVDELQQRIKTVESSKDNFTVSMKEIETHYQEALQMVGELQAAQTHIATTTGLPKDDSRVNPNTNFDLITALSDQMGAIEEQIGYLMGQMSSGNSGGRGRQRG